jgi:hypothetical protein
MVIDIGFAAKWMKLRDVRFLFEPYFVWCDVGECTGGVVVFGVNNVVDGFSKQG